MESLRFQAAGIPKFCLHHQDYGQTIEECDNFKFQVELEAKKGIRNEFIKGKDRSTNLVITPEQHINVAFFRVEAISKYDWRRF